MWNLIHCYLSGRHDYGMWCEPGAMFLRCVHCGKRSSGWAVEAEVSAARAAAPAGRPTARPVTPRRAASSRSIAPPRASRKLTVRVRRDHNNSRAGSPHHQRRAQSASRQRRASRSRRRPAQISLRTQHRQAARARVRIGAGAPRAAFPRDRDVVVYDSDPNELASSDVAAQLIRQGYKAVGAQGRHRRLARGQSADRNQRSAEAGHARTRGAERLARSDSPSTRRSNSSRRWRRCAATWPRRRCGRARVDLVRAHRHRVGRRHRSALRQPARRHAIPKCSSGCGRCTKPAAGCSSNRRSPISRPICAGCSSRAPSPSSSSRVIHRAPRRHLGRRHRRRRPRAASCARSPASTPRSKRRSRPRCRRCARAIPRIPLGRAVADRRDWCSIRCAPPASPGRCRSARCAAARTWSATSRSSRRPISPAAAIDALLEPADVVARAAPQRAPPVPADRPRADRRAPAGARQRRRRSAATSPDRARTSRRLQAHAAANGLTLDADGLHAQRRHAACRRPTEAEIYAALGLPFIPPEIRNGDDEIALGGQRRAAGAGRRATTSAAICTCTRCGATAATRSRRWSQAAARSATSTSRSPITRRTRPPRAT